MTGSENWHLIDFFLFKNTYTQGDGDAKPRIDFEFLKFFDGVRTKWGMCFYFGFF